MAVYRGEDGEEVERMPIPPLIHRSPECPLCGGDTDFNDGFWDCEHCQVSWNANQDYEPATFDQWEPVKEQCPEEISPYATSEHVNIRGYRFRCVREVGHTRREGSIGISNWHVGIRIDGESGPDPDHTYDWLDRR